MFLLTLFFACQDSKTIGGDTAADTDTPADTDTDTDSDTDTDTDADTDTGEPEPDWSAYVGERTFTADVWNYHCEESTDDEGVQLTEGDEYDQLTALCPLCTQFYENTPAQESVCDGYLGLGTTWRALLVTEQGVAVTFYSADDEGVPAESATDASTTFADGRLDFDYEISFYGVPVAVTGFVEFEMPEG